MRNIRGAVALLSTMVLSVPAHAALIRDYDLNGTLADSLGGPALVPIAASGSPVGSFTTVGAANGWGFGTNSGLQANGLTNTTNYSIQLRFSFEQITSWRRIIDFKNRTTDVGLYNYGGPIQFYPDTTGSVIFAPNQIVDIIVTRDGGSKAFNIYASGVNVLSRVDSGNDAVFDTAGNPLRFFVDDLVVPNEASAGFVDFIRIFDAPLTAREAECLQTGAPAACGIVVPPPSNVPEPETLALFGVGLAGMLLARRGARRRG
jgi:hypothetical protein